MEEICLFSDKAIEVRLIQESWEAAFKRPFQDKYWEWRFLNNPFEKAVKIAYVLCDGIVAAYYAVSPIVLNVPSSGLVKAGLMNMGFTHPKYQGNGYYVKINNLLHEALRNEGYYCCLGFANHNSHYPYRKYLGWQDLAVLNNITRAYVYDSIVLRNNVGTSYELSDINEEIIRQASHFRSCQDDLIYSPRSYAFLEWRILNHPNNRYECCLIKIDDKLSGILLFKEYQKIIIDVIEFFYDSGISAEKENVLCACLDFIQMKKKTEVSLWTNLYSDEHLQLEKRGFKENAFSTYFGLITFKQDPELNNIKNWHYRYIDSDVF